MSPLDQFIPPCDNLAGIKEVFFTDDRGNRLPTFFEEMEARYQKELKALQDAFTKNPTKVIFVRCWFCDNRPIEGKHYCHDHKDTEINFKHDG